MCHNKKGAALLQVLLITVVLAGMTAMLLRASLSRVTAARKTRRAVSAQMLINSCMAEVNNIWSLKQATAFQRDYDQCIMYCTAEDIGSPCPSGNQKKEHTCEITIADKTFEVKARFAENSPGSDNKCELVYTIETHNDDL